MTSHSTCIMCIFKCSYVSFYVFQGKGKSCKGGKLCPKCHRPAWPRYLKVIKTVFSNDTLSGPPNSGERTCISGQADNIWQSSSKQLWESNVLMLIFLFMSFRARENHVRVENYVQNVIANYSAEDFQRIYRLSHNCVEELCHILSACPLLFFRYNQAGIVTFPVYLPYFSAQRCMIEIIFMPDIYENNKTCRPNSRLGTWTRNRWGICEQKKILPSTLFSHDVAFYMYHVHLQMFLCWFFCLSGQRKIM
jgi:hypothetical protein